MAEEEKQAGVEPEAEKSEEDLINEWVNMAAEEGEEGGAGADGGMSELDERILDQNEIDSLLGVSDGDEGDNSGLRQLLENTTVTYERLPLLERIFDSFERYLSTSLRQFTADNVDVAIENITSIRFEEYLNSIPLPAGLVIVNAVGLDDYILVVYESRLIYAVVDILLGGRKAKPAKVEGRQFTTIERRMVENLSEVVLNELGVAFEPVSPVNFTFERMEVNTRFAQITREGNAVILVTVRVILEDRDGLMYFCIPYATLEPIREQLAQQFMGEKFGQDNIWENHLAHELHYTEVELSAVMDEKEFTLNEVMKWKLGDTIQFNAKPNAPVKVSVGDVYKLAGYVGHVDKQLAVRLTKNITDVNNEVKEG